MRAWKILLQVYCSFLFSSGCYNCIIYAPRSPCARNPLGPISHQPTGISQKATVQLVWRKLQSSSPSLDAVPLPTSPIARQCGAMASFQMTTAAWCATGWIPSCWTSAIFLLLCCLVFLFFFFYGFAQTQNGQRLPFSAVCFDILIAASFGHFDGHCPMTFNVTICATFNCRNISQASS